MTDQEGGVPDQYNNYQGLRVMSALKRKVDVLGQDAAGKEASECYGRRGLSEPPSNATQDTAVPLLPQRIQTANAAILAEKSTAQSAASVPHHPLAQPPLTADQSISPTAVTPPLPQVPPAVSALRRPLSRRRSSFPPVRTPSGSKMFSWAPTESPKAEFSLDTFLGLGANGVGTGWTPGTGAWEQLLKGETDGKPLSNIFDQTNAPEASTISGSPASTLTVHAGTDSNGTTPAAAPQPSTQSQTLKPPPMTPNKRIIQQSTDLEWRNALMSLVDVDGVGEVPVIRVLQEVWKRGGGDSVTALCLWPSIIVALATVEAGPNARVPMPSAQSSMSLQQLYNLNIRHWEPSIFSGLLSVYASGTMPHPEPGSQSMGFQSNHFGPTTPMRDTDLTQWVNLTPGAWSAQHDPFLSSNGVHSQAQAANTFGGFPFPFESERKLSVTDKDRCSSMAKLETGDDFVVQGLDEILTSMEDGQEAQDRSLVQKAMSAHQPQPLSVQIENRKIKQSEPVFHLPTPDTNSSVSPHPNHGNRPAFSPPVSMSSPYVSAGSVVSNAPSNASVTAPKSTKPRPTQLQLPAPVDFIPPPPMCMFFNPSFENLTDNKVGIWRGDLEVRGRGGGKFSVIIVGEKGSDHLWQSHRWPQKLEYPLKHCLDSDCYTSTMMPVSHLAREGLVPITMGMVLCNEPAERIDPYVKMVHGLHAEGVAFHLPCADPRLPVVLLPAKFHANDPLLRLGIAFMGKAGLPYPTAPLPDPSHDHAMIGSNDGSMGTLSEPRKKKRRQSAPPTSGKSNPGARRSSKEKRGVIEE